MKVNLILAGVGGQGILTIARGVGIAALQRNMHLRQAEVHGMSQRGGAVQSHLRVSDEQLYSDLIPTGQADLIVAVEPLEALRYVEYLRPGGAIVASSNAFVNIDNYPPLEQVLQQVASYPEHVLIDAERLAKQAGSIRCANVVMLGAASLRMDFDAQELVAAVGELFAAKGPKVVQQNQRAFWLGRRAAELYTIAIREGAPSRAVRTWLAELSAEELEQAVPPPFEPQEASSDLSPAEAHALERMLLDVQAGGRSRLYEHEVYRAIELVGAIAPPKYRFVARGSAFSAEMVREFPGDRVVLKVVSPTVTHKSDAGGVMFVEKSVGGVQRGIDQLVARCGRSEVAGVLVVEYVPNAGRGLGSELFVGIRATREFGPVIAAGLGGVDTEYLASKLRPGASVAKAVASDTSAERFLGLFKQTAAYELIAGLVRGHERVVSDGELLRCFRAFLAIARYFGRDRGDGGPTITELEVNPFAFRAEQLIPLDGRGRLGSVATAAPQRPVGKLRKLIEPKSIAVLGASATSENFGRIILRNVQRCGFATDKLFAVKPDVAELDGVKCVPSVGALPEPVDLLVVAAGAGQLPELIEQSVRTEKVHSAILIPGGVGETEGSADLQERVRSAILAGRKRPDGGPVFLGPNSLGVQSRLGNYDTFFIPGDKLPKRWDKPARRLALLSQSGAFMITRLSNLPTLDPALAVSIGNQSDLTVSDLVRECAERDDLDVLGVYVEGFNDLDGQAFLEAVERATAAGKLVIFYKAGRTESGRSAAAGHTASLAGDYDVCQAAATQAGALVVDTFKEFEQLLELAVTLHETQVNGRRIGVVSNAGFETVGMADTIQGARYELTLAKLSDESRARLIGVLAERHLDRLVNARNPLDLTPMADTDAYERATRELLASEEVDAVLVGIVPLTPTLPTDAETLAGPAGLPARLATLLREGGKPLVAVVDAGELYDPLVRALRSAGVPTLRSCDQAVRSLGRYLCQRSAMGEVGEGTAPRRSAGKPDSAAAMKR